MVLIGKEITDILMITGYGLVVKIWEWNLIIVTKKKDVKVVQENLKICSKKHFKYKKITDRFYVVYLLKENVIYQIKNSLISLIHVLCKKRNSV